MVSLNIAHALIHVVNIKLKLMKLKEAFGNYEHNFG
jgi:hypothetical protein